MRNFATMVIRYKICWEIGWYIADVIQKRLLTEDPLTLAKALEIAKGMESPAKNSATFNPDHQSTDTQRPVHQVQNSSTVTNCYHCSRQGHQLSTCKFKEAKCFSCSKIGHLKKVCWQKAIVHSRRQLQAILRQQKIVKMLLHKMIQKTKEKMNIHCTLWDQHQTHW